MIPDVEPNSQAVVVAMQDIEQELPTLPFMNVLRFLNSADLRRCASVNKAWRQASESDELWETLCQELWRDKTWVPPGLRTMMCRKAACLQSQEDCARMVITEQELCSFTWNFYFQPSVHTPRSLPAIHRFFHMEGQRLTAPKDDPLEAASGSRAHTWNLIPQPGSETTMLCVQTPFNRYPYLHISRSSDWGWCMENNWVIFTCNPDAGPNPGIGNEGSTCVKVMQAWTEFGLTSGNDDEDDEEEEEEEEDEEGLSEGAYSDHDFPS